MADRIFSHFGPVFVLSPLENPENQNFNKLKKLPGYMIILWMCTINDNHMMCGSWDMEHVPFLPFYPSIDPENQNFERMKKSTDHFTHVYHKWQSYDIWFLRYGLLLTNYLWIIYRQNFLSFWDYFFYLLPP